MINKLFVDKIATLVSNRLLAEARIEGITYTLSDFRDRLAQKIAGTTDTAARERIILAELKNFLGVFSNPAIPVLYILKSPKSAQLSPEQESMYKVLGVISISAASTLSAYFKAIDPRRTTGSTSGSTPKINPEQALLEIQEHLEGYVPGWPTLVYQPPAEKQKRGMKPGEYAGTGKIGRKAGVPTVVVRDIAAGCCTVYTYSPQNEDIVYNREDSTEAFANHIASSRAFQSGILEYLNAKFVNSSTDREGEAYQAAYQLASSAHRSKAAAAELYDFLYDDAKADRFTSLAPTDLYKDVKREFKTENPHLAFKKPGRKKGQVASPTASTQYKANKASRLQAQEAKPEGMQYLESSLNSAAALINMFTSRIIPEYEKDLRTGADAMTSNEQVLIEDIVKQSYDLVRLFEKLVDEYEDQLAEFMTPNR